MSQLSARHFRNILLIKPSSLGDCIQALPVLNALGQALPQAKISWLISSQYADIIHNHPALDGLILFNRQQFRSHHLGAHLMQELFHLFHDLRTTRFDLAIDLQGLLRSALMSRASGAPVRLGLADARESAGLFYSHHVKLQPTDIHAVDRYMGCLDALGIPSQQRNFSMPVNQKALAQIGEMLKPAELRSRRRFVLVIPGARWESKRWPADRFAAVIDRIQSLLALPCVLAGTIAEIQLCRRVARLCQRQPLNLAGKTSLAQLVALISRSALVLGHDSGTIHLAVALDKPLTCIIGPTDPKRTGPYRRTDSIVRSWTSCAPCRRSTCPDNKCMTAVSVEDVFAKVKAEITRLCPTQN